MKSNNITPAQCLLATSFLIFFQSMKRMGEILTGLWDRNWLKYQLKVGDSCHLSTDALWFWKTCALLVGYRPVFRTAGFNMCKGVHNLKYAVYHDFSCSKKSGLIEILIWKVCGMTLHFCSFFPVNFIKLISAVIEYFIHLRAIDYCSPVVYSRGSRIRRENLHKH